MFHQAWKNSVAILKILGSQSAAGHHRCKINQSLRRLDATEDEPGGREQASSGADWKTDVSKWRTALTNTGKQRSNLRRTKAIHVRK